MNLQHWHALGERAAQATRMGASGKSRLGVRKFERENGLKARDQVPLAIRFYEQYRGDDLRELLAARLPSGAELTVNHVRELLLVRDRNQRLALQRECVRDGWSIRQLALERVARLPPLKPSPGRGRPGTPPKPGRQSTLVVRTAAQAAMRKAKSCLDAEQQLLVIPLFERLVSVLDQQLNGGSDSADAA